MPRRRPRPGPHGSSLNDDAVQNTHHPAWRATRQPRQSLLIAQRRADFKRLGAGLPAALCRQRSARKRAGQDEKPSFGETVKKAAGGAQVQAERGEGTGPRSDAVWPVMPRQEGMDGGYPLAGSPQAGRGRNMQQHGQGGLLPARCRGGMELLWLPLCAGQGRLPAQQPSKQRRPTAMPGTSLQILVRETGFEPVWINRWILSPVRLPIPPLSQR